MQRDESSGRNCLQWPCSASVGATGGCTSLRPSCSLLAIRHLKPVGVPTSSWNCKLVFSRRRCSRGVLKTVASSPPSSTSSTSSPGLQGSVGPRVRMHKKDELRSLQKKKKDEKSLILFHLGKSARMCLSYVCKAFMSERLI